MKSYTVMDCEATEVTGETYPSSLCSEITAEFYRVAEPTNRDGYDVKFTTDDAGKKYEVVGAAYAWDEEFDGEAGYEVLGEIQQIEFVFPAFVEAANAGNGAELELSPAPAADNTQDDGATTMTTYAATLMAAVYALAF